MRFQKFVGSLLSVVGVTVIMQLLHPTGYSAVIIAVGVVLVGLGGVVYGDAASFDRPGFFKRIAEKNPGGSAR